MRISPKALAGFLLSIAARRRRSRRSPSKLLLGLLRRCRSILPGWIGEQWDAWRRWRVTRAGEVATQMEFEALEPRLLLSADLMPAAALDVQGMVYQWKGHALLADLTVQGASAGAAAASTDLFDLREAHYDGADNSATVQVWVNPVAATTTLGFSVQSGAGGSFSFEGALDANWTLQALNQGAGGLGVSAALAQGLPGVTGALQVGTLKVTLPAAATGTALEFGAIAVGASAVDGFGVQLFGQKTGGNGQFRFSGLPAGSYTINASRPANDSGTAVSSADALAALRIAVGLNPNADPDGAGPLTPLKLSPYQVIAADANQDGRITSADALAMLRMAVRSPLAPPQQWHLVRETPDLWNQGANASALGRTDANWNPSLDLELNGHQALNLVAVLRGDVNGSWAAPAGSTDLDVSAPAYFDALSTRLGVPLDAWGMPDPGFAPDEEPPAIASFGLAAPSDTGTVGDNLTASALVTLAGSTETEAQVTLMRGAVSLGSTLAAADGSFHFSAIALDAGANAFSVLVTDPSGNSDTRAVTITRQSSAPALLAALRNDAGASASDGLTNDPAIAGAAAGELAVTQLEAALDPGDTAVFVDLTASLQPNGSFVVTAAQLDALAGGTLADGSHVVRLRATDGGGASSSRDVTFTLERTAPAIVSLDLDPASDTAPAGDRSTTEAQVTLVGSAEAGALMTLRRGLATVATATAGSDGSFSFAGVALTSGANVFSLVARDAAGNTTGRNFTFVKEGEDDLVAPVLVAALQNDTGRSATDGVSREAAVAGSATDNFLVTVLEAALDPGDTPLFTSILQRQQQDGSFVLSAADLAALGGGPLADGSHTLRLRARDGAGNETVRELVFTLDTQAPSTATVGIAGADALLGTDDQTAAAIVQLRGTIEQGADLVLAAQGLSARAGAGGLVVLPGVSLALGGNPLAFTIVDAAGNSQAAPRTLTRVEQATTDPVLAWNDIALRAIQLDVTDVPPATRLLAMQSLAVYDALAAVEGTPAYLVQRSVAGPVSADAAAAVAAHRILALHYPAQKPVFDAALATSLAAIADGAAKDAGIALGLSVADAVWALRLDDGYDAFTTYPGSTELGMWRATEPMFLVAQAPHWKDLAPFALAAGDQLRRLAPPAVDTEAYALAVEEVKRLGSATSSERTADQTQVAQFWADGAGSLTPPGHWNQIAEEIARSRGNSLSANARLFAQLNVALADAAIACWDTKYGFGLWRPETAIRLADTDANAGTAVDAAWRPLLITPPHPEYVSGHSAFSAAAAAVLAATFGENTSFGTTSATLPGVTRNFTSFTQAAQEAGRSRIFGGIHYEFSNQAGQSLGRAVADVVLQRFALTEDVQPPTVVAEATPQAVGGNLTLRGQVLDNLSGVASAQYRLDAGALLELPLVDGRFELTTALALDGSADGNHTLTLVARDAAGNLGAGFVRAFVLDTRAPGLTLASIADDFALVAGTRLVGTADAGSSGLTLLNYTIDGQGARSIAFDAASGGFDQLLPFGHVDVGEHLLTLTARDAAGNTATLERSVVVEALAPFVVTDLSPSQGTSEVGVTVRPQVRFSRAVNAASLSADSFFATGPDGATLATTIVPALDGSYAWLFFNQPMPGSARITLHLDGSKIRAAADGAFLDADHDGTAGGLLAASYTTVSTTTLAGTKLVGRVVDPGPDLAPMTFDDVRRGPDGVIHTPDDDFVLPIAHAKVYILGRENQVVYTDAQGLFELDGIPAGSVKLAVDGRTATNAPAGVFFPEMVMHLELKAGVTNTAMGSMGSQAQRNANIDRQEIYLPRVQSSALQEVSDSAATVVTVTDAASAPQLTDAQRERLTLTVKPGSAVGEAGQILQNVQIGVGTVPPELVRDMLPPGVLEHTFDITIQAPGVATFAEPVQITFPNVFNAAPGSKLNILSFDHTTGMLVINGTGTVSADGLTVVSDPDAGIRAPGWHGLTPPGGCAGSGGPPPEPPPPDPTETVNDRVPVALAMIVGNAGADAFPTFTWNAPPENPGAPPLPPIEGCEVPPHRPGDTQQPFINVTIELDGPLATFAKSVANGLPLVSQSFTLSPGTGESKTFGFDARSYAEIFGADGFRNLTRDQLYGSKIKITVIEQHSDGSRTRDIQTFYQYRWVDVVDAEQSRNKAGATAAFFKTLNDGANGFVRDKFVNAHLPGGVTTNYEAPAPFQVADPGSGEFLALWRYDPTAAGNHAETITIKVNDPRLAAGGKVGELTTVAKAVDKTRLSVNLDDADGYKAELKRVLLSLQDVLFAGADGKPGVAGVDDDGNGSIDGAAEYGFAGSDDETKTVYVFPGLTGYLSQMTPGADGKAGVAGIDDDGNGTIDDLGDYGAAGSDDVRRFFASGVEGTDYKLVSARFAGEFAGYMPVARGVGTDGVARTVDDVFSAVQLGGMDTRIDLAADALLAAVQADFSFLGNAFILQRTNAGADVVMTWKDLGAGLFGGTSKYDSNRAKMRELVGTPGRTDPVTGNTFTLEIPEVAQQWALSQYINTDPADTGEFGIGINVDFNNAGATFAQYVANTVSHELAHTFGLNEGYFTQGRVRDGTGVRPGGGTAQVRADGNAFPYDIMMNGQAGDPNLSFRGPNTDLLRAAVGVAANTSEPLTDALRLWRDSFNLVNGRYADGGHDQDGMRDAASDPLTTPEITLETQTQSLFGLAGETLALGEAAADGAGGAVVERTVTIVNDGRAALTLASVAVVGDSAFSLVGASLAGTVLQPLETAQIVLRFDPSVVAPPQSALLRIVSDAGQMPVLQVALTGGSYAASANPVVAVRANNAGGVQLAVGALVRDEAFTITNTGAETLLISAAAVIDGIGTFSLVGLPPDLAAAPIALARGESWSLGFRFDPDRVGLARGLFRLTTNSPAGQLLLGAVGTGLEGVPRAQWGDDFAAVVAGGSTLRTVSNDSGAFEFFLPAVSPYALSIFDPDSGLLGQSFGTTAPSGRGTDLTSSLVFLPASGNDSDFDGLPDAIEDAIGSNARTRDTDNDGLDDFIEIQQGLDPLGGLGIPTGVAASLALRGSAEAVVVFAPPGSGQVATALVATGSHGLATVDVSQFLQPLVRSELDLAGTSIDVAVDATRGLAAVAANEAGLHIVDVSDPAAPVLVQTLAFGAPARAVEVRDGSAFVAAGNTVSSIDLVTGEVRVALMLGTAGGPGIVDLALEGNVLYTLDSANTLRAVGIDGFHLTARGALALPAGGGRLFVGGGVAYVGAGDGGTAGFLTANVADPANLVLLSGVDDNALAGTAVVANGSGLAIGVGSSSFVFGGFRALDVFNVSDPANTAGFVTRINLPEVPRSLALANGLAFVAGGAGGLQVVNYAGFDSQGVAPTVTITAQGTDVDPGTPGVQVLEGRTVRVLPTITDDVQLRNVQLLVNGQVVATDVAFPWELFAQAPIIAAGGNQLTLQVRATDTGGNVGLSNVLVLSVVPDTFAPQVSSVSLEEGARRFFVRSVDIAFDEPLDTTRLGATTARLVRAGGDGSFDTGDDVAVPVRLETRNFGQSLSVVVDGFLAAGDYRFTLDADSVSDRAGNQLAADVVRHFSIRPASDVRAASGAPDAPAAPSANPGQQIGIAVPFDPATARAQFATTNSAGTLGSRVLNAVRFDAARGLAFFNVPLDAITGDAVVYSQVGNVRTDFADGSFLLQIVPVISDVQVEFVAADGSQAQILIAGLGLVEGGGSEYRFGSEAVIDANASSGPDVFGRSDPALGYTDTGHVRVSVALSDGVFGPISLRTAGGTSASYSVSLSSITGVALRGTPANAAEASANPGQAVTLRGTGLHTGTDVLLRWTNNEGVPQMTRLNPGSAAADGSSATLIVPRDANGAYRLQVFGSASQPLLQIVPVLEGFDVSSSQLVLAGAGLVEGAGSYAFQGITLADGDVDAATDVYYSANFNAQNGRVYFNSSLARHGLGTVTTSTAGGTSDPLALNFLRLAAEGTALGDVAVAPNGDLWTSDYTNPGHLLRVNPASGAVLQTLTLGDDFGTPYSFNHTGLQFVGAMTLGSTAVPAGTLLVFNGYPFPDRVVAVDVATGAVRAFLELEGNIDLTAGVYDATTQHLFVLESNGPGNRMIELSAATGAVIASITLPLNVRTDAGLAIDPLSGNLWIGASNERGTLVEVTRAGVEVRRLDLRSQGVDDHEVSGLAFGADGALRVASTQGVIYRVDRNADGAGVATATLGQVLALAGQGVAANAGQASANVGQVIELVGSNFGAGTRVLFDTRDNAGVRQTVAVAPLVMNGGGSRMQVLVPELATTGEVRVVNQGWRDLGFTSYADAVYRGVTVNFTAGGSTATIRFADAGLEDVGNESWGLDNVRVTAAGGATVFADDFEGAGAAAQWAGPRIESGERTAFSRFLGRVASGGQTLNLAGLTAGQSYTLRFDLLAIDSWDGASRNAGPDIFDVSVDGVSRLRETLSNGFGADQVQTLRATPGIRLQIVPTLSGTENRPGENNEFTLVGSGFMEGASTVSVGGVTFPDIATNGYPLDVYGQRNDRMSVMVNRTLDGPIRISTEGGYAQLALPTLAQQPLSQFSAIVAGAEGGTIANAAQPSANTGQAIVLHGQGFTSSTLVQFQGVDGAGVAGTITRTGSAGNNGTTLSVVVPALARSGAVTVLGSGTSLALQVVPTLRAVSGTVAQGNTLLIEGTGLVAPELVVSVGGRAVGSFTVRTISDASGTGNQRDQQLLTLVVPAGTSGNEVIVSTLGGSSSSRRALGFAELGVQAQASDPGDTLLAAVAIGQLGDARLALTASIGDGAQGTRDVDLYAVALEARTTLRLGVSSTDLTSRVRIFNAAGAELAARNFGTNDANQLVFTVPAAGTYYIGIGGNANSSYNPATAGSGTVGDTGSYRLNVESQRAGSSRLVAIQASAGSGTAALAGLPAANTGQVITLSGVELVAGDRVAFTTIDSGGTIGETIVTPTAVDLGAQTLTVTVPDSATTGRVRLERDASGIVLQVVPTVTDVSMNPGSQYVGSTLTVRGSGFAEGAGSLHLGSQRIDDLLPSQGIDVFGSAGSNNVMNVTVPATTPALPTGPIRVSTAGGTSAAFGLSLASITATAASGSAANAGQPSASPGQVITLNGSGFDTTTDIVFQTIAGNGNRSDVVVRPATVSADGTQAQVQVPLQALSGSVRLVGDVNGTDVPLQVVPVIQDVRVEFVAGDGSYAQLLIAGLGLVEGGNSEYRFGSEFVLDGGLNTGPDVFGRSDPALGYTDTGHVRVSVALSDGVFGPISLRTAGGTSASYSVSLSSITGVALRGTPANAAEASANPGQAVTLRGTGLHTGTDVLLRWTNNEGVPQMTRLNPGSAAADGSSATLIVPRDANGAYRLQVFGSASQPLLQIVPVLEGFDVSSSQLVLAGAGLVEGAGSYAFQGITLADGDVDAATDVYYSANFNAQNGRVYFNSSLARHGLGTVTTSTAGGTSDPLALNFLRLAAEGTALGDVAVAPNGDLWTSDYTNPGHLLRVNPASGAVLQTLTLGDDFGTPYSFNHTGLQFVGAMTLGSTAVPAGTLLVFNGYPFPDRVVAVDVATGAVRAFLELEGNIDLTAGVYDATTQHLFVLESNGPGNRMIELSAATGAVIASITLPLNVRTDAGLAIDPLSGNLWIGASNERGTLVEVTRAGVEVRRLDLRSQGVDDHEVSGLAFGADGALRVASTQGVIYRVDRNADGAGVATATLGQVLALAGQGVAANAGQASANVGQVIELVGSNFGAGTRVLFDTRDNAGVRQTVAVAPLVMNGGGTRMQVLVPELATTGEVRVVNQGWRDLGFTSYADAVYRGVTVNFTAGGSTATIRFADAGLEDVGNESWGLDNVRVTAAGGATVFADDFEGAGAAAQWAGPRIESGERTAFSRFLGRVASGGQTLNLAGLTAGQSYTLRFDLLAIDSWDGASRNAGPDIFDVSVDGVSRLRETLSNGFGADQVQTLRATPGIRLQIVPTLSGTENRPGENNEFTLVGSGFMEGASTVSVGGVTFPDIATNGYPLDVYGQRNDRMSVMVNRTLDGPIRISTEGGYAQLALPTLAQQPLSQFSAIVAGAEGGTIANAAQPSANTGQAIVLHGQGFTSSTLVQFQGVDGAGVAGTITRTGSAGNNGTTLSVVVPALARSGAVTVLGSGTSLALQVVPTLRAVSGTVAQGNTLLIEGTGLVAPELVVSVGGRAVGSFTVRTISDASGTGNQRDQQLLTLVVPAGTSGNEVIVSTLGGSSSSRRALGFAELGVQAQASDPGDTLLAAVAIGQLGDARLALTASIGDGAQGTRDVDLYAVALEARTTLRLGVSSTDLTSRVRIFNAAGAELAARNFGTNDANQLVFTVPAAGTYYIGIGGNANSSYNPATAGSGTVGDTGSYRLNVESQRAGSSRLVAIQASAGSGTAALAGLPAANTGQVITLSGVELVAGDRVAFTTIDSGGTIGETIVTPTAVDLGAQTLTVTVPDSATTGRVRLERDASGIVLQVVPTVTDVSMNPGSQYVGSTLTVRGSGFAEGAGSLHLGSQRIDDLLPSQGIDVFGSAGSNNVMNVTVPATTPALPTGPIRVSTAGGTSAAFGLSLASITATAASGSAANAGQPSASPGQVITLNGSGFDTTTDIVFQTIAGNGNRSDVVVRPATVSADGTQAQVQVPLQALSGSVRLVGDVNGTDVPLQVVPVIQDVRVEFVAGDGSYAQLLIAGLGLVEGGNSEYRFGSEFVLDGGLNTGPDVFGRSDPALGYTDTGHVRVSVALSDGVFGPISLRTAGGTSASYSVSLSSITGVALRGTPANAAEASANPGQAVTLRGTGLHTGTDVLLRWTNNEGVPQMTRLNPGSAAADGSSATLIVPRDANGAYRLQVFGSASQPLLQIVPVLEGFDVQGTQLALNGAGLVEGATGYSFTGVTLADNNIDDAIDVYYDPGFGAQNGRVLFNSALPRHGMGAVTATTAGGTSEALTINFLRVAAEGTTLGDVAVAANGNLWTSDSANPGHLLRVNSGTGAVAQTITLTDAFGTPYLFNHAGMQFVGAMTLGATAVPAGSLLVFNGQPSPDRVVAVNAATGAVLASLALDDNYDLTAGVYDASTQHLFVLEGNGPGNRMIELSAATGALLNAISLSLNVQSHAGLAIDPATGNLWVGSYYEDWELVELTRTGTQVRRLDLRGQGIDGNEIAGLAFAPDGALLVASTHGVILRVSTA